jgi:PAS domain S-box-containing protein
VGSIPVEQLRAMAGCQHGLWHRDLVTGRMWFSPPFWKVTLGLTGQDLGTDRNNLLDRVHPDDRAKIDLEIERHRRGETPIYECDFRVKHEDGSYRWIRSRGTLFKDEGTGQHLAIAGSHEDITSHKDFERLYISILDAFPGMFWVKDDALKFVFINGAVEKAYGTTRQEATGKTEKDFVNDLGQVRKFEEDDRQVFATGKPVRTTETLTGYEGTHYALDVVKLPLQQSVPFWGAGKMLLGFALDVTKLDHVTLELQQERQTLLDIMASVPDGIFLKDRDGRFVRVNRALVALVGCSTEDEVIGRRVEELIHDEEYVTAVREEEEELFRTANPIRKVRQIPTSDGRSWHLITKVPIRDANGTVKQLCGVSRDISDLKAIEEELDEILNALPQHIFVKDNQGRYVHCNRAWAEKHNLKSPEDVLGKDDYDFSDPKQAAKYRKDDETVRTTNEPLRRRETRDLPDGSTRILDTTKIPLHDKNNRPVRVLGIYEDITDRIAEDTLKFHKEVARTISHCLKNWMAVVTENVTEIEECHAGLSKDRAFLRLKRATDYLLQAARVATQISALDGKREEVVIDINSELASLSSVVSDPRVIFVHGEGKPRCRVLVGHFQNALMEIIANARDHAPPVHEGGRIEVYLEVTDAQCLIHVEDNGQGVPAALGERVFAIYVTADPKRTGMGLGYAKWVCEACRGEIHLVEPDHPTSHLRGAHFVMVLPREVE